MQEADSLIEVPSLASRSTGSATPPGSRGLPDGSGCRFDIMRAQRPDRGPECSGGSSQEPDREVETVNNPLPSWHDTTTRKTIIDFVSAVTDSSGADYRPPDERLAVFDNDGTLWCEQPMIQGVYAMGKLAAAAKSDPSLASKQPYKAAATGDSTWVNHAVAKYYNGDMADAKILGAALAKAFNMTVEAFETDAAAFLRTASHPRFHVPYTDMTFVPMIELLDYLRTNGFAVYMTSGGGRDFVRPIARKIYGITPDQIIGSSVKEEFVVDATGANIMRTGELDFIDDGPGKPIHIWNRTGRRPIFAAGNANGDIPMLQYTTTQAGRTLGLLVHHDDEARDPAYDAGCEKAFAAAADNGWHIVSVKDDWKKVYSFEG